MDRPHHDPRFIEARELVRQGALEQAYERFRALTEGPLHDDPAAVVWHGRLAGGLQKASEAVVVLDRVPALGDPVYTAWSLVFRSLASNHLGRFADAIEDVREAMRRARKLDDPGLLVEALLAATSVFHRIGAVELAVEQVEEAIACALEHGRDEDVARSAVVAEPAMVSLGRRGEAVAQLESGMAWAEANARHELARRVGNKLALSMMRAGRLDAAVGMLDRVAALPGELTGLALTEALQVRWDIGLLRGQDDADVYDALVGNVESTLIPAFMDIEAALSRGDLQAAEVALRRFDELLPPSFIPAAQGSTTLWAVWHAERGEWDQVEGLLSMPHLQRSNSAVDLQRWFDRIGELADVAGKTVIRALAWSLAYPFYALHGHPRAAEILEALRRHEGTFPVGAFDIGPVIGAGGMGRVYEGVHRRSKLPVVLKVLKPPKRGAKQMAKLFEREIRRMTGLSHPGVLPAYDYGVIGTCAAAARGFEEGAPYVVLPRLEGDLTRFAGQLGWSQLRSVLLQVLDALAEAHAHHQLHLDVKADNLLYRHTSKGMQVWLADFGLAVTYAELGTRRAGTPNNMAPEQWQANPTAIGPWTDMYALGCTAFRLLTGSPPFIGSLEMLEHAHHHAPRPGIEHDGVPDGLEDWLARMMAVDPRDRFRRAQDAKDALLALGGGGWAPSHVPLARAVIDAGLGLAPHRRAPIEGRDDERAQLWQALAQARHGPIELELVGRAGAGTTSLARWIGQTHHRDGGQFWDVHLGALGVVQGLRDVLRRVVVRCSRGPDEVEQMARELGLPAPAQLAAVATGLLPPDQALSAFLEVAAEAARWRPLVVLLDEHTEPVDLPDAPLLVIRTARAGEGLQLGRLSDAEIASSLSDLAPLEPRTAQLLARLARGNPGHAHQLLLACIEQHLLTSGEVGYVLGDSWIRSLPTTYAATLEARLRHLVGGANFELVGQLAKHGRAVPRMTWTTLFPHLEPLWPVLERAGLGVELPGLRVWRHRDLFERLRTPSEG